MTHWQKLAIAAVAAIGLAGAAAQQSVAAPVTFQFKGTVTSVSAALSPPFNIGDTLSGSYTFESTTAPRGGSNATTAVFDALTSLTLTIGGYTASSNAAAEIQTGNRDDIAEFTDRYFVLSRASEGLSGPNVGSALLVAFGFRIDDSTGNVFASALDLPTTLDLSDFDATDFGLDFELDGEPVRVGGFLTRIGLPVPAPGMVALFGLATLLAGGLVRRRA